MINIRGKNVTVFGLGQSGIACAKKLVELGANVTATEKRTEDELDKNNVSMLRDLGVKLELGGHTSGSTEKSSLIVMSPGIHIDIPVIKDAKSRGVPVISEIELAFNFIKKPIIAVTGTNGKTTTVSLISEMLKSSGKRTVAAGNIGNPLISIDDKNLDIIVLEVSSYQLETIATFKPWISILLNITEDHMERHKSMDEYAKAKSRIFENQDSGGFTIYNADDRYIQSVINNSKAKLIPFSLKQELEYGLFLRDNGLIAKLSSEEIEVCKKDEMKLIGGHNIENALASVAAGLISGINLQSIKKTLSNFEGLEHRIEHVKTLSGVDFYNDSKGTNPDSTIAALKTLGSNIVLIAGGKDKGVDISHLVAEIKKTSRITILIGEAKKRFHDALTSQGFNNVLSASSLQDAVKTAFEKAKKGDKVLLSPACSSFDMFRNFEERGALFKDTVMALKEIKK